MCIHKSFRQAVTALGHKVKGHTDKGRQPWVNYFPSPAPSASLCTFAIKQMYFHIIFMAHPLPNQYKCEYICKHVYESVYLFVSFLCKQCACLFSVCSSPLLPFILSLFCGCFISYVFFTLHTHSMLFCDAL